MYLNNNTSKHEVREMQRKYLEACNNSLNHLQISSLEKVKSAVFLGVDVNAVSGDGKESGLVNAIKQGNLDILEFLLSQPKIDVNIKVRPADHLHNLNLGNDDQGKWTPLMFACAYGKHEVVERLIQVYNIDLWHKDDEGYTALHLAAMKGHHECVRVLTTTMPSLDWNCEDKRGWTPLHLALWFGRAECVRIIASLPGVDLNAMTDSGQTLTQAAIIGSSNECVQILADIETFNWNRVDQFGDSPLMTTLKKGKREMFNILVNCPRVYISMMDSNGATPAMWARKHGMIEQAEMIERLSPSRSSDMSGLRSALPTPTPRERRKKVPECPICMDPFARDGRIFHCVSGHFICEACKAFLVSPVCPKCKQGFSGRAHDFEDHINENFY